MERAISARVTEQARKRVESWGITERTDTDDMDEHMGERVERKMALQGDGGEQQKTERSVRDDMEEWVRSQEEEERDDGGEQQKTERSVKEDMEEWMRKKQDEEQKRAFREDMEIWKRNA